MKATIVYRLSSAGQKASILAGGNGAAEQIIEVPSDAPEFAAVVQAGRIDDKGNVTLQTHGASWPGSDWTYDTAQTAASVLARLADAKAAKDKEEADRVSKIRADTLAVISERKTTKRRDTVSVEEGGVRGVADVEYETVNWPYSRDDSVVKSEAGQLFERDLRVEELAARAEAEKLAQADLVVNKAAAEEKAQRDAEAKAKRDAIKVEMGGTSDDVLLRIEEGAALRDGHVWMLGISQPRQELAGNDHGQPEQTWRLGAGLRCEGAGRLLLHATDAQRRRGGRVRR